MLIMKDNKYPTTKHMKFQSPLLKLVTRLTLTNEQELIKWTERNLILRYCAIDFFRLLGEGEHGLVYKGILVESETEVAIKSSRHSATSVKQLLSEIKILIHVGPHKNVLNLIAANTCELQKGMYRNHFSKVKLVVGEF